MIPKQIHYCWFGQKPPPRLVKRCMASWERHCPDYKLNCWDETNASLKDNSYVRQAYQAGKWAFVSDYVRLKVLAEYGGIYLDTDVELVRPLDQYLCGDMFIGFESAKKVATCVVGAAPGHPFIEHLVELYSARSFRTEDGRLDETTNVDYITRELVKRGLCLNGARQQVENISLYPTECFSCKSLETGKITVTSNTAAIHHFQASWMSPRQRFHTKLAQWLGPQNTEQVKGFLGRYHDD